MSRVDVVFRSHVPCPVCGYQRETVRFSRVDVLAQRLREHGVGLALLPGDCRECGWRERPGAMESIPARWQLDAADRAKVDAVHARKFPKRQRIKAFSSHAETAV